MKNRKFIFRMLSLLMVMAAIVAIGFSSIVLQGCGDEDDDDECLSWGENCTQQYLQDNYGTTSVPCCEGRCADHGSGILTCGS